MTGNPIRISEYFDNALASKILNEDELVIAPIIIHIPMSLRSRQHTSIKEDDFDNSYSNETGHVDSITPAIIASIIVTAKCYDKIDSPHFIPFFSGGIGEPTSEGDIKITPTYLSDDKDRPDVVVECENMAYILTLAGREVYIPVFVEGENCPYPDMPTARLNYEVLPGYACYRYGPGDKFHKMVTVDQDIVSRKAGTNFNSPIINVDEQINIDTYDYVDKSVDVSKLPKNDYENRTTCPECRKRVHLEKCLDCGMTYGRRGWRQIGVYDG